MFTLCIPVLVIKIVLCVVRLAIALYSKTGLDMLYLQLCSTMPQSPNCVIDMGPTVIKLN